MYKKVHQKGRLSCLACNIRWMPSRSDVHDLEFRVGIVS
jgi:hypothetical protein